MQSSQENSTHFHVVLHGILYKIINPVFSDWNSQISPAPSNLPAITNTQESRKCTRKSACWAGTKYSEARISGLRSVASHSDSIFSLLYAAFTDTRRSTLRERQGRAQNIIRSLLFLFCLIKIYFWLGGFPWFQRSQRPLSISDFSTISASEIHCYEFGKIPSLRPTALNWQHTILYHCFSPLFYCVYLGID